MAISKIIYKSSAEAEGEVWMDVTQKTVTSGTMLSGTTALKNDGTDITGNIATKTSANLSASGATVTAPAGYYATDASKSVASGSATTPATSITANPSISVSSGGLITASVSASQSVTPTVSAGYVSSGTSGTVSVSGSNTEQLTTQAAQTIHPSTTDQTIASGKYLTGTQTVKGVLLTNLSAGNIKKDVVVKVGDSTDDDYITSVTGTFEGGGGGSRYTLLATDEVTVNTSSTSATVVKNISVPDAWQNGKIVYVRVRDKAGQRNEYFCGADSWFFVSDDVNITSSCTIDGVKLTIRYKDNTYSTNNNATGYGVFGYQLKKDYAAGDMYITIAARYNSNYSLTINGTYTCQVYLLEWPDNTSPFVF